jgi:hypothetical protein
MPVEWARLGIDRAPGPVWADVVPSNTASYEGELFGAGDFDPAWTRERAIGDPWGKGASAFA